MVKTFGKTLLVVGALALGTAGCAVRSTTVNNESEPLAQGESGGEASEHPHGGPPGQTGEHPHGGPPGQTEDGEDHDRGRGNDADGEDSDNPGRGRGNR